MVYWESIGGWARPRRSDGGEGTIAVMEREECAPRPQSQRESVQGEETPWRGWVGVPRGLVIQVQGHREGVKGHPDLLCEGKSPRKIEVALERLGPLGGVCCWWGSFPSHPGRALWAIAQLFTAVLLVRCSD